MKLRMIVVDSEMSPRTRRRLAGAAVACLVVGAAAVAWAGPLHTWNQGDTLSAADLNGNFSGLDGRITALEAKAPATLVSESEVVEQGAGAYADLVYQSIKLDLTPGTWLVHGSASLTTTIQADAVQIGLWDDGQGAEVPQSRSPIGATGWGAACDGVTTFCSPVALATTSLVTVTANTTLRLKAYRNGDSTVWIGGPDPNHLVVLPRANRLTAIRIK